MADQKEGLKSELKSAVEKHHEDQPKEDEGNAGNNESNDPMLKMTAELQAAADKATDTENLEHAIEQLVLDEKQNEKNEEAALGYSLSDDAKTMQQKFRQAAASGALPVMRSMLQNKLVDINTPHETVSGL